MRNALFKAGDVGRGSGFFDLPPADTCAEGNMLLAADGNHGDAGVGAQGKQHFGFHALVHGQPLAGHNEVAVVAHPLWLVLAHTRLQERGIVVNAELAGGANDGAWTEQIPVGEGGLHPVSEWDAFAVCAAEAARTCAGAWVVGAAGGGVDDLSRAHSAASMRRLSCQRER